MALIRSLMATGFAAPAAQQVVDDVLLAGVATGTTQADALELSNGSNVIATTASGTGVKLWRNAQIGDTQCVFNDGANDLAVYPPTGCTVNGAAADASITISSGQWAKFRKVSATAWKCSYDSGLFLQSGSAASLTVQEKLRQTKAMVDFITDESIRAAVIAGTNVADLTTYVQAALDSGYNLDLQGYTFYANNLTDNDASKSLVSTVGIGKIIKNANGALFTSSGANYTCINVSFRGDAASPTYTGDGAVFTGNHPILINCGSRWFSGRALKCTGGHAQIYGTCDIYQTTDATASGYDIEIGVSGTATLYHELHGIYTSQSTGGILATDVGSMAILGGEFGKLNIAAGTSPAGVNGGTTLGARILGNIDVGISNATFNGCHVGAVTATFAAGTSGHVFEGNEVDNSATLTDNSSNSSIVDPRQVAFQSYTPAWTGSVVDPAIGDGSIIGRYTRRGYTCTAVATITMGSTTTFGTGTWFVSLPFVPSTALEQNGSLRITDTGTAFYVGTVQTLTDATARVQLYTNAAANVVTSAIPMTWASGDSLSFSITYSVKPGN